MFYASSCGDKTFLEALGFIGMNFVNNSGAKIWMKSAGEGPPVIFLHGGPGYCSYSFEHSAGPLLEKSLRMIYFDQRDCGRSSETDADAAFDVDTLVSDIEAVRKTADVETVGLLGHSFGGVLALEYLRRFPSEVSGLILLESTPDLAAMIEYQTEKLAELSAKYPQLSEIESSNSKLEKLFALQNRLNWFDLQKEMFWNQAAGLIKNTALDVESRLFERQAIRLLGALAASGYLESAHEDLQSRVPVKCAMFSGRQSHCIGFENVERMSAKLGCDLQWFEHSGHMPYIEEPDLFAQKVREFFRPT